MRRPQSTQGFALIEALIALAITLVGLTGVLRLQAGLAAASADAKASDEAVALAQTRLTEILREPEPAASLNLPAGSSVHPGVLHDYRLILTPTPTTVPTVSRIVIQVHWPAADPLRHIELQVLLFAHETARLAAQQLQLQRN